MRTRRWRKSLITRVLSLVMCILFVSFTASPAVVYGAKWNGVVRPGVMVGDSENETDFFLDIFLPLKEYQAGFVFVNPHIRLGDDGSHEGNLGLGYRGLYNDRYILGANAFLDTMESGEGNRFNQFGLGAELMSHWFDARANYYNPIGDDKKREPGLDEFRFGPSSLLQALGYEEALGGFDAEVGALIPGISDFMETRAYVGAYWYDSDIVDDDDVDGFKYRVEVRPAPAIDLIAEFKDDDIRGNDTFFGGYIELPFEDLLSFKVAKNAFSFGQGARPIKDRMMDKVVRDRHIQTVMGPEAPGNESIAYPMIYVNQDNDSGTDGCDDPSLVGTTCDGAGTLTDPYEDIGSVEYDGRYDEGVWVYVFSWDDVVDTYFDLDDTFTDITLLDDMVLWGQGFQLGNLGGDGPNPILDGESSPGNYVVELADNNEVMGLTMQNGGHNIFGDTGRIMDEGVEETGALFRTNIHDNIIQDSVGFDSGIHIESSLSDTDISGERFNFRIVDNEIVHNDGNGVYIEVDVDAENITNTSITTLFAGNTISDNTDNGVYLNFDVAASGSTINNVSISNTFSDNTITDNSDDGVEMYNYIYATSSVTDEDGDVSAGINQADITNTFTDNDISSNGYYGVYAENYIYADASLTAGSADNVLADVSNSGISNTFTGNVINDNYYNGVYVDSGIYADASAAFATVADSVSATVDPTGIENTFTDNEINSNNEYDSSGYYGVELYNYIYADASARSSDVGACDYYGDCDGGVLAEVDDGTIENTFAGNTITDTYYSGGVYVENEVSASASAIEDSDINGGVLALVDPSGIVNTFTGNDISGNDYYGVQLYNDLFADASSTSGSTVGECNYYGECEGGVSSEVINGSIENSFAGNTLSGNDNGGVYIYSALYAETGLFNSGDIAGDVSSLVDPSGIENTFTGNEVFGNDGDGIEAHSTLSAETDVTNYSGSTTVSGDATATVEDGTIVNTASNNTINGNNGAGVYLDNDLHADASAFAATYYGSSADTTVEGDVAALVDPSGITNTFTSNDIFSNSGDGVEMYNDLYADASASAYAQGGVVFASTTVGGDVSATVDPSGITNTFVVNEIFANSDDGVDIENDLTAEASASSFTNAYYGDAATTVGECDYYGACDGGVVALTEDATIVNTFISNGIDANSDTGVDLDSDLHADASASAQTYYQTYYSVYGYSETFVADGVTALVDPSGITNAFTGNSVSSNTGGDGTGMNIDNLLYAEASASARAGYNLVDGESIVLVGDCNFYGECEGDVSAEVLNSTIETALTDNDINNNSSDGVELDNDMYASVYASSSAYNNYYNGLAVAAIAGDVTALVDPSGITNTFTGNSISGNSGDGVDLDNDLYAVADASAFAGFVDSGDEAGALTLVGDCYYYSCDGSISAQVNNSSIDNTFTDNDVDGNSSDGIDVDSELYADASASARVSYVDGSAFAITAAGDATSLVDPSSITNTFTGNSVSGNGDTGIELDNSIRAGGYYSTVSASIYYASYYGLAVAAIGDCYYGECEGGVSSSVIDAAIENTFTDNAVNGNGSEGFDVDNELYADASVSADSYYTYYGAAVAMAADVSALVAPSGITNTFTNNSISGNSDEGVELDNRLYAEASASADADMFYYGGFFSSGAADVTVGDCYYGSCEGGVLAAVNDGTIVNTFTDNVIDHNENDGVEMTNELYAAVSVSASASDSYYSGFASTEVASASALVDPSSITNTFSNNSVSENGYYGGDGVDIQNDLYAEASVYTSASDNKYFSYYVGGPYYGYYYADASIAAFTTVGDCYYGSCSGGLTADVENSTIVNALSDNVVDNNGNEGVQLDNSLYARASVDTDLSDINDNYDYYGYYSSSATATTTINGDVSAAVDPSGIENTLSGNSVSQNGDDGVRIDNELFAEATVDTDSYNGTSDTSAVSTVGECGYYGCDGSVTAEVIDGTIANTFTDNNIDNNDDGGVDMTNNLHASASVDTDASPSGSYYAVALTDVAVDVEALVDPSGIENTFTGNSITWNDDSYGVYMDNDLYAEADARSSADYDGDATTNVGGCAGPYYGGCDGDVGAEVLDSSIDNTFANNDISDNASVGVTMDNDLYATSFAGASVTNITPPLTSAATDVKNDVYAVVDPSGITNTFTDNNISGNSGDGVNMTNNLYAEATADLYYFGAFYSGSTDIGDDVYAGVTGDAYYGIPTGIENTFSGNTINDNSGDGVYEDNNLYADADAYYSTVGGDVAAEVYYSTVESSFDNNYITGNSDDGIDADNALYASADVDSSSVGGDVVAIVDPSGIANTFTGNAISNSDEGVVLDNDLYARADVDDSSTGDVSAEVYYGTIDNTFDENIIDGNGDEGVDIDSLLHANVDVYYSDAGAVSAIVAGSDYYGIPSGITNEFTGNSISGNSDDGVDIMTNDVYAEADVTGDGVTSVLAAVYDSTVENTFDANTIDDNGDSGVEVDSRIYADATVTSSTVTGDVSADVDPSGITNTFTDNSISGNSSTGVDLMNTISVSASATTGSSIGGNDLTSKITDAFIENTFTSNTVDGNGSDGISVADDITATAVDSSGTAANVDASIDPTTIDNDFTSNTVTGNSGDGVRIDDFSSADDTEDVVVTTTMEGNTVIGNSDYGVELAYIGGGTYTADLGTDDDDDGIPETAGNNSFGDMVSPNGDDDLFCSTDGTVSVSAEGNWWGADEDPDDAVDDLTDRIGGDDDDGPGCDEDPGDGIDCDPWLSSAP